MKKAKIIIIFLLVILLFTACSNSRSANKAESEATLNGFNIITTEEESTTKNENITHTDIEKVIISYLDNREELTEEQQSFDFIEEIKECDTVPSASLTMKIGDIKIKYVDKEEAENFATLYLGVDGGIYAKYNQCDSPDFAYKFE